MDVRAANIANSGNNFLKGINGVSLLKNPMLAYPIIEASRNLRFGHQIRHGNLYKIPQRNPAMDIKRIGSQPSGKGPAEWFTGSVRVDPLFSAPAPARVVGASVTFEPGARTAWHTHPLGQTLIVTAGWGRAQRWGGPIEEIRPGDVVWIPPGEKHWHGATPTTAMTHFAIQEQLDGKAVDWMEKVSEEQYQS
jgi:quercetin dioxygenase-like cupin family protein